MAVTTAALVLGSGPLPRAETGYWGQAQSHLETFRGRPLFSANWHGRYRPYVLKGNRIVPLFGQSAAPDVDLYSPVALSDTEVLLAGTRLGRPRFDLYLYDMRSRRLLNLTRTDDVDEGRLCVSPRDRIVSYAAGPVQVFARIDRALLPLRQAPVPRLEQCLFTSGTRALGIRRRARGAELFACTVRGERVRCERREALDELEDVVKLSPLPAGRVAVIGRRRGAEFRRAFVIGPAGRRLAPAPLGHRVRGDVLDYDGTAYRYGLHGFYRSSLAPDFDGVVSTTRRIGPTYFAILATPRLPRTPARLGPAGWVPIAPPGVTVPRSVARPRETWLRSPGGDRYQAFAFGRPSPKVVVWWHGGPRESVSPRFNPYYQMLAELGFSVLAVNYPGSTGRGREFERRFDEGSLTDCLRAVWAYLAQNSASHVVSWSVSTGNVVQLVLLKHGFPLSGLVDQSGWGRSDLLERAAAQRVRVFTIRGRFDPHAPVERVDYRYDGGHDITLGADFAELARRISAFLRDLPPLPPARAGAIDGQRVEEPAR